MATSKELLTLQEQGAQIRILVGGEPTGGPVEHSPRYKGDRSPWVKVENTTRYRYTAKECGAAQEKEEKEESVTDQKITAEVIEALRVLRNSAGTPGAAHQRAMKTALDILDNAGVFAAIDEATGYDIDAVPPCTCPGGTWEGQKHLTGCAAEKVSKCTCPANWRFRGVHDRGCPGDPAEWGDAAFKYPVRNDWDAAQAEQNKGLDGYRAADRRAFPAETIPCDHCRGDYKPKKDGQPRKHNCWRFDHHLQTTTFGPLDVHGRSNTSE